MTDISNLNVLIEPTQADLEKIGDEADVFDPTEAGKKIVEPDDDFDDIELETPQACGLEECESCS